MRRYSVIGNDPSFKQYTKNHDYNTIKYQQQRRDSRASAALEQSVLSVSLKDLALGPDGQGNTKPLALDNDGDDDSE